LLLLVALLPTMLASWCALALALLRPPLPVARPSVLSRTSAVRAVLAEDKVVGQFEAANPTDSFSGKLYNKREVPPVFGGLRVGTRRVVVVTGATSGLGLWCTKALCDTGKYFVICGVRNPEKMEKAALEVGIGKNDYLAMKLELGSLQSVRDFVSNLKAFLPARPLNHLICNAAVYRPADPKPAWTDDGYEMSVGVNHLGHFLLLQLLLPDLRRAKNARVCVVGSITGNSNTIGGGFVYPRAEVGEVQGLKQGPGSAMVDGGNFDGAKAYKDAKALNMMTVTELHRRLHDETGITFSSMYPGCIAETNLFREKRGWFKTIFPLFMKYVTGAYVSEVEAGARLAQVVSDPQCTKSGVYWSWNGNAQQVGLKSRVLNKETGEWEWQIQGAGGSGGEIFENQFSGMIKDERRAKLVYDYSMDAVRDFL